MTYKLTESLGLKVYEVPKGEMLVCRMAMVKASDLESLLEKGVRVYGKHPQEGQWGWSSGKFDADTHSALILNIKPLEQEKPVTASELKDFFKIMAHRFDTLEYANQVRKISERLDKAGVSNV